MNVNKWDICVVYVVLLLSLSTSQWAIAQCIDSSYGSRILTEIIDQWAFLLTWIKFIPSMNEIITISERGRSSAFSYNFVRAAGN